MNRRDIALAFIRREVEETGELTVFALRAAQEHRIGYAAMMSAAREGLRRRGRHADKAPAGAPRPKAAASPPSAVTPMTPQNRITAAQAELATIRTALARHELLLADARRSGMPAEEIARIETLISNDLGLIQAWERRIAEEEQAATDPELLKLRARVDALSFEECVVAIITREHAGPLSVPMNTPENLVHLRDVVFEFARKGQLTLAPEANQPPRGARRLPIVTIDGKRYYRDSRLREYRAVDNPHDRLPL